MSKFRVALSGDFRKADGSPTYPSFDLSPLTTDPEVEMVFVDAVDGVMPAAGLAGCDALILLVPKFGKASVPPDGKLAVVARFGVGYDSVDVPACTEAGIALCITPDGVRRPVAVSILTFILALTQKLLIKDRLCRQGPEGWAKRSDHMGEGVVGKTLGQLGMGNIGAEVFRLAAPFGMRFIAHDPYQDPKVAADLGVELVDIE
jgi:phosphoglycerate dehydrogenase-like enzyme